MLSGLVSPDGPLVHPLWWFCRTAIMLCRIPSKNRGRQLPAHERPRLSRLGPAGGVYWNLTVSLSHPRIRRRCAFFWARRLVGRMRQVILFSGSPRAMAPEEPTTTDGSATTRGLTSPWRDNHTCWNFGGNSERLKTLSKSGCLSHGFLDPAGISSMKLHQCGWPLTGSVGDSKWMWGLSTVGCGFGRWRHQILSFVFFSRLPSGP